MNDEYEIQLVEDWTFLNPQRNPVSGYRVTFYVPELGITDHIVISKAAYNSDNVHKAIQEKVALHKGVMSSL